MNSPNPERNPQARPASSDQPPKPPPPTAGGSRGKPPAGPGKTVFVLDPVLVRELAATLGIKPFQVVADLLEMKQFKTADDEIDFETASAIARKHGYRAERPPPGVLVL